MSGEVNRIAVVGLGNVGYWTTTALGLAMLGCASSVGLLFAAWCVLGLGMAMGLSAGLAFLVGPILGGVIMTFATWQWLFVINLTIALVVIAKRPAHPQNKRVPVPNSRYNPKLAAELASQSE